MPGKRFAPEDARKLLQSVCETLLFLHGKGIAHMDLKLGNVLVARDEEGISYDFDTHLSDDMFDSDEEE